MGLGYLFSSNPLNLSYGGKYVDDTQHSKILVCRCFYSIIVSVIIHTDNFVSSSLGLKTIDIGTFPCFSMAPAEYPYHLLSKMIKRTTRTPNQKNIKREREVVGEEEKKQNEKERNI